MPNYATNDPKGWCGDPTRGAALGRPTIQNAPLDFAGRVHVRRVRLSNGGYDRNGTYFGIGRPLYWAANEEGDIDFMLRATSRSEARKNVLARYPNASVRS
jgi:hypothetical protein